MKVSVVVPAHDEEDTIGAALESILNQTRPPDEVVVVNDGSADRTREIVEEFARSHPQVTLLNFDSGHSAAFARNRGSEATSGDAILFFDADHVIPKKTVEEIVRLFEAGADAVSYRVITKPESFIQKCFHANQVSFAQKFYGLSEAPKDAVEITSANMAAPFCFRKNVFEEAGCYDETVFYFEDRLILKTLISAGKKIMYNPKAVVYHQDPRDFSEFLRQVRFIGRGLSTYDNIGEKLKVILPGLLWYGVAASTLLSFSSKIFLLPALLLAGILLYETLVRAYYSRDIIHSIGYMTLLSLRGLILTPRCLKSLFK